MELNKQDLLEIEKYLDLHDITYFDAYHQIQERLLPAIKEYINDKYDKQLQQKEQEIKKLNMAWDCDKAALKEGWNKVELLDKAIEIEQQLLQQKEQELQEAKSKLDVCIDKLELCQDEAQVLNGIANKRLDRIKELEEALQWYADVNNYCSDILNTELATAYKRGGIAKKAQQALNKPSK